MAVSFNAFPRIAALLLVSVAGSAAAASLAMGAEPDRGTVSLEQPRTAWKGKVFTGGSSGQARLACDLSSDACDEFTLTVDIDPSHYDGREGGVEVAIRWKNRLDDYDLFAEDASGETVGRSVNTSGTSERLFIEKANRRDGPYRIVVNPYLVEEGSTYTGGALVVDRATVGPGAGGVPIESMSGEPCRGGDAGGIFACRGVDLEGFLPVPALNGGVEFDATGELVELNDIWGWTDPETGREYALVGKSTGTAFVDITEPRAPRYLGSLPSSQRFPVLDEPVSTIYRKWRDVKVYADHAFIVAEEPGHGMQVFDLKRLRGVQEPQLFDEDALYQRVPTVPGFGADPEAMGNSHNIAINEDSGFAYSVGTDTCEGGLHMIDIRKPKAPEFAGCFAGDGYTHDAQCVIYKGPDDRFAGREICFNSNEDTLTIVDVTDKDKPVRLARLPYEGAQYAHQGWLTEDSRYFLLGDELDEQELEHNTRTRIFDVSRLDAPKLRGIYDGETPAVDHNLYVRGTNVFEANYRAGLRILDASAIDQGTLKEKAFFDIFPLDDAAEMNGAWSNFPYYRSGLVVVSGIEQGLFVLRPHGEEVGSVDPQPDEPPCAADAGFGSVTAKRSGRGVRFGFEAATQAPVRIDVFRASRGRRTGRPRRVARLKGRTSPVKWAGRGRRVTDGFYFARFRISTPHGRDTRHVALRRRNGRFSRQPGFARPAGCGLLRGFQVNGPVFGGTHRRPLVVAFRVARATEASVTVKRGSRVVRRFKTFTARGGRTERLRLPDKRLRRGLYRVKLTLRDGDRRTTAVVRSRRL